MARSHSRSFQPMSSADPCHRGAADCICSQESATAYNRSWLPPDLFEHCVPGPECFRDTSEASSYSSPHHATRARTRAANAQAAAVRASIVLVMGHDPSNVRPQFMSDHWGSYYANCLTAIRLILSLRRVKTQLPIALLASGYRDPRWETLITRLGVTILNGPNISRPYWSRLWHKGSFSTLALVSLAQFERVIFLENDAVSARRMHQPHARCGARLLNLLLLVQTLSPSPLTRLSPSPRLGGWAAGGSRQHRPPRSRPHSLVCKLLVRHLLLPSCRVEGSSNAGAREACGTACGMWHVACGMWHVAVRR